MIGTFAILVSLAAGALGQYPGAVSSEPPPIPATVCTGAPGHAHHHHRDGLCVGHGQITPDGPGFGWGFANGAADGYGWFDYGTTLPLGGNRTSEYYFRRKFAVPAPQAFFPTYYNVYITRGQRYIPYVGDGGDHPAGGAPTGSARLSEQPYQEFLRSQGQGVAVPRLNGRSEAPPVAPGNSGLIP